MFYRHTARDVARELSPAEFARLCGLLDLGFGDLAPGGPRLGHRNGFAVADRRGAVKFDVYRVRRVPGDVAVAVSLGRGVFGEVMLSRTAAEVKAILSSEGAA